ncbi:hypothetical protein QPK24_06150 [Paenibacillus polygoni]|uniref:GAF domain-containing protein n=1 Tax=Paenibacillus polygoni TaxID=3050112 RepID=A0ABY8X408_9BACL|nr:hypothetical protein [Paenibacillus polygoni]WIV20272.1 hypothetical protein QPK24_06150 [Paenibacillus polygoni]
MTEPSSHHQTIQKQIQTELEQLKSELELDFIAVALADENYRDIHWKMALGANTERYKKIMVRMGKGMAGRVLKTKAPYIVNYFPEEVQDEMLEYPIFLIESIRSGMGVSVDSSRPEQKLSYGVLLVGQREERIFSPQEVERVEQSAAALAALYDHTASFVSLVEPDEAEQADLTGPLLQKLRSLHNEGVQCELLDQRLTRLSSHRQQEIAEVLDVLVHDYYSGLSNAKITMEQDAIGYTFVVYEGEGACSHTHETFHTLRELLRSLKSDLEVSVAQNRQSVRFAIPTRQLLDEIHWEV